MTNKLFPIRLKYALQGMPRKAVALSLEHPLDFTRYAFVVYLKVIGLQFLFFYRSQCLDDLVIVLFKNELLLWEPCLVQPAHIIRRSP